MSKQRYVSTSFWDDPWIQELDPRQKLMFLYLITNPLTNIAGVYEISLRRIAFDTGYNEETVQSILDVFKAARKAYLYEGWLIIPKATRHQRLKPPKDEAEKPSNVKKGIDRILLDLPQNIWIALQSCAYEYVYLQDIKSSRSSLNTQQINSEGVLNSDSYSDLDSDLDSNPNGTAGVVDTFEPQQTDPVLAAYRDGIDKHLPSPAWPDTRKQFSDLREMADRTRKLAPNSAIPDPEDFARAILDAFGRRKASEKSTFWSKASWTPKSLWVRFGDLVSDLIDYHETSAKDAEGVKVMEEHYARRANR